MSDEQLTREQCEEMLAATLEVVGEQRKQLDMLRGELAQAVEETSGLRLELERERESRLAAEARLRESSVDFARRLSTMQARVLEAERDVVLGGQVLVTRSAPSSSGGLYPPPALPVSSSSASCDSTPGRSLQPVPPPPRPADDAAFSRPQVLRVPGGGPAFPAGGATRRARSGQARLDPLPTGPAAPARSGL
eukprot:TRINITY_DN47036_c0_g1_i1.p2 TRINITY_DN47036_c0_g1~~TRINITY_DN47036_c0_g1_i1.p2  ORF type:complete len:193 (+),score=49.80 TRINITY_DN47036_c0_g1_i1:105-683(+)